MAKDNGRTVVSSRDACCKLTKDKRRGWGVGGEVITELCCPGIELEDSET